MASVHWLKTRVLETRLFHKEGNYELISDMDEGVGGKLGSGAGLECNGMIGIDLNGESMGICLTEDSLNNLEAHRINAEDSAFNLFSLWTESLLFENSNKFQMFCNSIIDLLIIIRKSNKMVKYLTLEKNNFNVDTYERAMRLCAVTHNWIGIEVLFETLIRSGKLPTIQALDYYCNSLIHNDKDMKAKRAILAMIDAGLIPSTDSFRLICIRLFKNNHLEQAEELYKLAVDIHGMKTLSDINNGYKWDGPDLNSVRSMWLIKMKLYDETEKHLNWCLKYIDDEHKNANILNGIVCQLANENWDQSIYFLRFMLKNKFMPSARTVDAVLDSALDLGRSMRAASLILELNRYKEMNKEKKLCINISSIHQKITLEDKESQESVSNNKSKQDQWTPW